MFECWGLGFARLPTPNTYLTALSAHGALRACLSPASVPDVLGSGPCAPKVGKLFPHRAFRNHNRLCCYFDRVLRRKARRRFGYRTFLIRTGRQASAQHQASLLQVQADVHWARDLQSAWMTLAKGANHLQLDAFCAVDPPDPPCPRLNIL